MRALVTGGTGFVGSHVVERLLSEGHPTRVLLRCISKGQWLEEKGAELCQGDVTDLASLARATAGIDVVFHLAAMVSEWGAWPKFQAVTVAGTNNVLTAAVESGVPRFLHVSTATVYDDAFSRRQRIIAEDAPHGACGDRAYGNYSKAKVLAEQAVWRFHADGKIQATVVRPAWIYGPRDATILPQLIEHLKGPLACWIGRKDPVVDPIYVTDVARCASLAAASERAIGQAYNVAPHREIRLREFLGTLCRELGLPLPRWSLPYSMAFTATALCEAWARLTGTVDAPALTQAGLASFTVDQRFDPSKAMRELGWTPEVSLDEGAFQTAAWHASL
jgi:nucleoside-diphosphate-sugar epimerase